MNSQQELLEAIQTISKGRDRSFDTPATVLRVEGDTVWVHIDGGADETPALKTINCSEGETVQVRISNGNAFLVGNASAPPTDDKTANAAHFVAEQADEKATEAIRSVGAIEQTVEGKVDKGDSNIEVLSSTMYQNENGVNIYNNTLAVGDSYAHIDGNSFDIKVCTTAGQIDDANDGMYASFGREVTVGTRKAGSTVGNYSQVYGADCEASGLYSNAIGYQCKAGGKYSHAAGSYNEAKGDNAFATGAFSKAIGDISHAEGLSVRATGECSFAEGYYTEANGNGSHAQNLQTIADSDFQTVIGQLNISDANGIYAFIIGNGTIDQYGALHRSDAFRVDWSGNVQIGGEVKGLNGNRKYVAEPSSEGTSGQVLKTDGAGGRTWGSVIQPTILESSTISASTTSYTFTDSAITADSTVEVFDEIDGFEYTTCSTSAGSCTITFPAQSTSHKIKLHVW